MYYLANVAQSETHPGRMQAAATEGATYLGGLGRQVDGLLEGGPPVVHGAGGRVHEAQRVRLGERDQVGGGEGGVQQQQQQRHVRLVTQ